VIAEFEKYGILHREKDGYVYPHTNQAATVVNGLYHACTQFGVTIYEDCEVEQITKKKEFLGYVNPVFRGKKEPERTTFGEIKGETEGLTDD